MGLYIIFWRNYKWRLKNWVSVIVTILQPLLWLLLYGTIASVSMRNFISQNYISFIVPGLLVLVTFSSSGSSGMINFIMKRNGSLKRIMIAPIKKQFVVLGQIAESTICGLFESSIILIISFCLGAQYNFSVSSFFLLIVLLVFTGMTFSSLSYFISLALPNEIIYETVMNAIVLPIFFLSSALFPLNNLSGGLKYAVSINLFNHVIFNLRNLTQGIIDYDYYVATVFILIISIVIMLFLNTQRIKKIVKDM